MLVVKASMVFFCLCGLIVVGCGERSVGEKNKPEDELSEFASDDQADAEEDPDLDLSGPSDLDDAAEISGDLDIDQPDISRDLAPELVEDIVDVAADLSEDEASSPPENCVVGTKTGECAPACGVDQGAVDGVCSGGLTCCLASDPNVGTLCEVKGAAGLCLETVDCVGDHMSYAGYCPGPSQVQCCVPDSGTGTTDCDPDAPVYINEGLVEAPGLGGCPPGMVPVDDFCIDQYEAFLVELDADDEELPWSPYHNPGAHRVRAKSAYGAIAQGYINQIQASAACQEAGKRLCTDNEWLLACRGSAANIYPYGDTRQAGVCNDARSHPAVEYYGTNADWIWSALDNACISQLDDTVDGSGSNAGCVSEYGAYDMMGNVHEWTANSTGVFRGGFYADTSINGEGCLYDTEAHNVSHWDYSTGFRCCAD